MKKNKKQAKKTMHSMPSNIFYMTKVMFKICPLLVIGEIVLHLVNMLPSKLISVIGIKFVIDNVTSGGDTKDVIIGISLILGILVLSVIFNVLFFEFFAHRERERLDLGLQKILYKKASEIDLSNYDNPEYYADFILAVENSTDSIKHLIRGIKSYVGQIVTLLIIGTIIFTIDKGALLIIIIPSLISVPFAKYTGKIMNESRTNDTETHREGDYFARVFYLQEYSNEIRTNGLYGILKKRFSESADKIIKTHSEFWRKINSLFFVQDFFTEALGSVLCLTLYLGYKTLYLKEMSAGDFVATFNGAVQIGNSIVYILVYAIRYFSERAEVIEKIRSFLSLTNRITDGHHIAECSAPETIKLKNVSFNYEGNENEALSNINLEIKPYEKIALVGYNGAGKTTLTNLLLRLYDVTEGSIVIGDRDIKEETVYSHRDRFSAVFQDFKIFSATVGENVALDSSYDEERVYEALKNAGFNKELPNGLKTVVLKEFCDDGLMLSGGEQQKLAIARAFYKNCPYVILDEPSANLDPISEYELNQAVINNAKDKTVIFISHRLSTTKNADKIFMLENGKIIESGTHNELMELSGKYAEMFFVQAEKYISEN